MPVLTEEELPTALMLNLPVQVTNVEVRVVGVVASQVELELTAGLPPVVGFRREELEAQNRVVHAQRRRVVAIVVLHVPIAARTDVVRVHRQIRAMRIMDRLEHEVAIRFELETAFRERIEDPRRGIGQIELAAVAHRPDAARLVRLRALTRRDDTCARFGRGRCDDASLALELGDSLRLCLDLRILLLNQRLQRLQIGLRDDIRWGSFHRTNQTRTEPQCNQCFFHSL